MIKILRSLKPRFYNPGDYIIEQDDAVDEHIFVISCDPRKPISSSGRYCVGFNHELDHKRYFHVKLGPKSIINGYENMFGQNAEYTYKAL